MGYQPVNSTSSRMLRMRKRSELTAIVCKPRICADSFTGWAASSRVAPSAARGPDRTRDYRRRGDARPGCATYGRAEAGSGPVVCWRARTAHRGAGGAGWAPTYLARWQTSRRPVSSRFPGVFGECLKILRSVAEHPVNGSYYRIGCYRMGVQLRSDSGLRWGRGPRSDRNRNANRLLD
jgi:hypothetical protein